MMQLSDSSPALSLRPPRQRAFVTTMAIMLIALVAVAVAALTARVGTVARQARQAREQAQVEQLILAGMDLARQGAAEDRAIALPAALTDEGAALRLVKNGKAVEVEASFGRTRMREVMGTKAAPAVK